MISDRFNMFIRLAQMKNDTHFVPSLIFNAETILAISFQLKTTGHLLFDSSITCSFVVNLKKSNIEFYGSTARSDQNINPFHS